MIILFVSYMEDDDHDNVYTDFIMIIMIIIIIIFV